jgi:hypothetical protein
MREQLNGVMFNYRLPDGSYFFRKTFRTIISQSVTATKKKSNVNIQISEALLYTIAPVGSGDVTLKNTAKMNPTA